MALLLESLRIENYRVFRQLQIARLGRANLFVGKNNTGKSSILEAVRLYASHGNEEVLWSILESHDETRVGSDHVEDRVFAVKQLLHGRDVRSGFGIGIGPIGDQSRLLTIRIDWSVPQNSREAPGPEIVTSFGDSKRVFPLDFDTQQWSLVSAWHASDSLPRQSYVSPNGLSAEHAARLWDLIALTDLEDHVTEALRIISREIDRISFIGEQGRNRIPMAKLSSQVRPVPLRSLGDGVNRMLGIALSLVSARGGVLLVDEVENGIHFTAQLQLWQMLFRLAHRLDTQIFATTHSWDCIEAFQRAAVADAHEDAALIRLDAQDDAVLPTTFTENELSIVTRDAIEVR